MHNRKKGGTQIGPRHNQTIIASTVRVIDADGNNLGVMSTSDALKRAYALELDLVEISPNVDPPVAKICDFGRYKYDAQKKAAATRKTQKIQDTKEIKIRPTIDPHDLGIKMKKVFEFLNDGDKVKISMRFKGREFSHINVGRDLMLKVSDMLPDTAKVETQPKMDGKQMLMIVVPK